ncbi:transcriptional regulator, AlpA family [Carnobacterium alterfunditum]|uniref:Transcriptional regulator, AlpA family n=2 Tax=Carnobacterium alterfunditum TaxID=28230 RepID=A0A1N6FS35_9LACT|nr:transcriptional regulator, AlpA family [Carnobacterium alterfunditum]
MEQQTFGLFSKEIQEQIAKFLETMLGNVAEESKNKGGKRYFKKKDFCEEIGISYGTLAKWLTKGLKVIHVEQITMIDMRDAEKFLQDHKI